MIETDLTVGASTKDTFFSGRQEVPQDAPAGVLIEITPPPGQRVIITHLAPVAYTVFQVSLKFDDSLVFYGNLVSLDSVSPGDMFVAQSWDTTIVISACGILSLTGGINQKFKLETDVNTAKALVYAYKFGV